MTFFHLFQSVTPSHTRAVYYPNLDFLRGIAALTVVVFHFSSRMEFNGLFNHGYLAVDFFVCLSGFIIERSYRERVEAGNLGFGGFVLVRAIRLLPMVALGIVVAAIIDLFRPGQHSVGQHIIDIIVAATLSLFLLPVPWKTTLEQTTYPLNGPVWSLFFEVVANMVHFLIFRARHGTLIFIALATVSFFILIQASGKSDDIHFGPHWSHFLFGFPRIFFSYSMGAMVARADLRSLRLNRWIAASVLVAIVSCPQLETGLNRLVDLIAVGVIFPALVAASATTDGHRPPSALAIWLGEISYPIYMIHYPLVRGLGTIGRMLPPSAALTAVFVLACTAALAIVSAWLFRSVDTPARARLSAHLLRRTAIST